MIKTRPVYEGLHKSEDSDDFKKSVKLRHNDYNVISSLPEGKRIIEDILYFSAIDRTAYCSKSDTQTNFNLGKQSVGYYIAAALESLKELPQPPIKEENHD